MSESKQYPVVKRVELAGFSEQWDESCYAYVVPTNYHDQLATITNKISELPPKEQIQAQLDFVKEHFVSGRIKVFDGEVFKLVKMEPEHTGATVDLTDYLYSEIMGLGIDPKELRRAATSKTSTKTDTKPSTTPLPETPDSTSKQ